ncbi:host attachment protein [Flexistipes sinusarabici]|uniref:host attachment protein n=1 Tax=Flexistipes sinusarabici TaxID=2352 RepID=UPI0023522BC9|nr:host attachment protein [Flexistipes sinusarabici]
MSEIIIVTDAGYFEAYEVIEEIMESPRLEMIKKFANVDARTKFSEKVTDQAGRFGRDQGGGNVVKSYGEPHNLEQEIEKNVIKTIVEETNKIINKHKPKKWYLAAEKTINNRIVEQLDDNVRDSLAKNVKADLTKKGKKELLAYFK